MMKQFLGNSYLYGANAPFIEALYDSYLADPQSVEPRWRGYFDELQRLDDGPRDVSHSEIQERFVRLARERRPAAVAVGGVQSQLGEKQFAVLQMISAYRVQGARNADVDPLGRREMPYISELDPANYGITDSDMETVFNTGTLF
ncbi:MAG TPA: 2-oxoglutarate dehydrogenase E1 component, partial [Burkholderiales bacterium]|nr:2-oxoglutarate dehydrogenase E1 component [Burkholderiales bacterium]